MKGRRDMSMEKITAAITGEARREAERILSEARQTAETIRAEARQTAERMRRKAEKDGAAEEKKIISRRDAAADIDSRKMLLMAKRELMDRCFNEALQAFASMEQDDYLAFLAGMVERTGLSHGEIILSARDHAAFGAQLLEALNRDDGQFTLAEEDGAFAAGLILRAGEVYFNGTVESCIDDARESMAMEIADILFE